MARKRKNKQERTNIRRVVTLLMAATLMFCALTSWNDKNGKVVGLPGFALSTPDFLQDVLDGFADGDSGGEVVDISSPIANAKLEVHFLDVGQGESILIKAPSANVLIDAGETDKGDGVVRYLKSQGVRQLDYVIGTHPHSDHIGGLDTVIHSLRVGAVILPALNDDQVPTTRTYTDLLQAVLDSGLRVTDAKPGRSYDLGGGVELTLLGPVGIYSDLNNMSIVCRLDYGQTSFLFTGDAESGAENHLLDNGRRLRADVLSVGHHGSNTSTSAAFLQEVSPRVAVISCGLDNSYGHPHREVMEALQARNTRIYRTDLNGVIVFASDGERLAVNTQNEGRAA